MLFKYDNLMVGQDVAYYLYGVAKDQKDIIKS